MDSDNPQDVLVTYDHEAPWAAEVHDPIAIVIASTEGGAVRLVRYPPAYYLWNGGHSHGLAPFEVFFRYKQIVGEHRTALPASQQPAID